LEVLIVFDRPIIKSIDMTPQIKNFLHALGIQGQ